MAKTSSGWLRQIRRGARQPKAPSDASRRAVRSGAPPREIADDDVRRGDRPSLSRRPATCSTSPTRRSRRSITPDGISPRPVLASLARSYAAARSDGGSQLVAQSDRPGRDSASARSRRLPDAVASRPDRRAALDGGSRTRWSAVILGDDPQVDSRRDARGAAAKDARPPSWPARLRMRRRCGIARFPTQQRIRRLGHRASQLHFRQRGASGAWPRADSWSCCAAPSTLR